MATRGGSKTPVVLFDVNGNPLEQTFGGPADAAATNDNGTFSLIALTKRLLGKLTTNLLADALALFTGINANAANLLYNGATLDLQRGNVEGTALASAARTVTTNSAWFTNFNGRGVYLFLNVTAVSGTGGLTLRIQAQDPVSGLFANLNAAPTAITATGLQVYTLYPSNGIGAQSINGALPRTFRVQVVHGDASAYTYSVGYSLIV